MQYRDLKNKAKKLGLRVTKNVNGKRVKLTANELRSKITMNFENSVKNAQKVIRLCQTVVAPGRTPSVASSKPPPPPPPPRVTNNKRAKLMAELKAALAKKGLRQ
jgi:hypothetical protein